MKNNKKINSTFLKRLFLSFLTIISFSKGNPEGNNQGTLETGNKSQSHIQDGTVTPSTPEIKDGNKGEKAPERQLTNEQITQIENMIAEKRKEAFTNEQIGQIKNIVAEERKQPLGNEQTAQIENIIDNKTTYIIATAKAQNAISEIDKELLNKMMLEKITNLPAWPQIKQAVQESTTKTMQDPEFQKQLSKDFNNETINNHDTIVSMQKRLQSLETNQQHQGGTLPPKAAEASDTEQTKTITAALSKSIAALKQENDTLKQAGILLGICTTGCLIALAYLTLKFNSLDNQDNSEE
jgi:hypothetical protein